MNSSLYSGQVYHKRRRPAVHELRYQVFSLLLDLDDIDKLHKRLWCFSRNRWNLFSFYDKDFGEDENESLKAYVQRKLVSSGIHQMPQSILLSCYPRICGYTFNPLSLFYCFDKNGKAFAVLHEVHNTFGERHVYVLPVDSTLPEEPQAALRQQAALEQQAARIDGNKGQAQWIEQVASKALFVSPFAHMNMKYEFRLNVPDEKQVIVIRVHDEHGHLLTASYTANREVLNAKALLRCFLRFPALTLKVTLGIHWEAMRLWLKRVPWFSHQAKHTFSDNKLKNP